MPFFFFLWSQRATDRFILSTFFKDAQDVFVSLEDTSVLINNKQPAANCCMLHRATTRYVVTPPPSPYPHKKPSCALMEIRDPPMLKPLSRKEENDRFPFKCRLPSRIEYKLCKDD